jgi:hypothetical protein
VKKITVVVGAVFLLIAAGFFLTHENQMADERGPGPMGVTFVTQEIGSGLQSTTTTLP